MDNTIVTINNIVHTYNNKELVGNRLAPDNSIVEILTRIINSQLHNCNEDDPDDIIDALKCMIDNIGDDFRLNFDGAEYRIIAESAIWPTYVREIKAIVEDCYDLKLNDIPNFVAWAIDWEQTANNAYIDGYGHTFSQHDGSEEQAGNYYIFRTD